MGLELVIKINISLGSKRQLWNDQLQGIKILFNKMPLL